MKDSEVKEYVKKRYGEIAQRGSSCCSSSCCNPSAADTALQIGYSEEEIRQAPEGANLGLGCGNPVALASLKEGETVLDLGSGAGFDCLLAASRVGPKGKVIGIDMTPEMLEKARENAEKGNYENVEFKLGEIEDLPVTDSSVDVIISNCVINLSSDKRRVFAEAFRVLKPGGRLMISDIVLLKELPEPIKNSLEAYVGCISGATIKDEYIDIITSAGFQEVKIIGETAFPIEFIANDPTAKAVIDELGIPLKRIEEIADSIVSVKVQGLKPN